MFTIADIRNIAIQIEHNGEKTYRKAAEEAGDARMAELFTKMAEDEKCHAQWFESITSIKPLTEEQREMEAVGRTILQEMVKSQTFSLDGEALQKAENMEDVVLQAEGFERDTIIFYEMLSGFIEDEEAMRQLKLIIEEERSHLEKLREVSGRTVV